MLRHTRKSLYLLLIVCLLGLLPAAHPLHAAPPPPSDPPSPTAIGIPPLPRSCIGGAPLSDFAEAICCVSGYVYLNGVPVANADVTITVAGRTLVTHTQSGAGSTMPYYSASLNAAPLDAQPGDSVTITATAGGQTQSRTFIAQEGGWQEDVVLPQSSVEAAWVQGQIPGRHNHAMAYDAARQRVVLFGGNQGEISVLNDTWEWDGTTWTQMTPPTTPSAREGHAMAYDAVRQRVVMFGGISWQGSTWISNNETWEWDGETWTQRQPTVSPSARSGAAMVYDAARQRIVLFGGQNNADTWEWNGTTWTQRNQPTSPPAGSKMAYDMERQRVVLVSSGGGDFALSETWEWDGTTWTQISTTTPSARYGYTMAYDPIRQHTVLVTNDATWEWDGSTWNQYALATIHISRSAMVYDLAHQRMLLFGGGIVTWSFIEVWDDTWERNGTVWTQRILSSQPVTRSKPALAYESAGTSLLFGGSYGTTLMNDTYRWDGTTWK